MEDVSDPPFRAVCKEQGADIMYTEFISSEALIRDAAKSIHRYTCQVCEFNFEQDYGELGEEYIEAHHLTPLAKLLTDEKIAKSAKDDFRVVCANCHRMIHRKGAPSSFEDFKVLYTQVFTPK